MKKLLCFLIVLAAAVGATPLYACTGIVATDGGKVLVGNNEDWFNPNTKIWFEPGRAGRLGVVYFGFDDFYPQGGMNEKGLIFDIYALKPMKTADSGKPPFMGILPKEIMATCSTVEQALALMEKYNRRFFFKSQALLADAAGDAAIVEGDAIIRKKGPHLVVSNFRQSLVKKSDIKCPRYLLAKGMLEKSGQVTVSFMRRILDATHQELFAQTLYSNIYDPKEKRIYLYHFHNYQNEVVIDLMEELKKGPHTLDLPALFPATYAAKAWVADISELAKTYRHDSPSFTVRHPKSYVRVDKLSDETFTTLANRYGGLPSLTVGAVPAPKLPEVLACGEVFVSILKRFGKGVRLLSNSPVKLKDGTPAYEGEIHWWWPGGFKIRTLVLTVFRGDKLVLLALHSRHKPEAYKYILYSLSFE